MTVTVSSGANVRVLSETRGKFGTMVAVAEELRKADLHELPEELKVSEEDRPRDADNFEYVDIPSIDLSLIDTDRTELARKVGEAARQWGIFRILNHGIPANVMKELEIHGLNFFGQSDEEKSKLLNSGNRKCYYTRDNTEEKRHSLHWAESFVMFLNQWTSLDLDVIKQATLDWSTADDEFRNVLHDYLIRLKSASDKLLELFAESLGLKSDFYISSTLRSAIVGRWNYYPACPLPADVLGAHSHTDPNFLTFIQQDSVGGLQVEKGGRWYNVKPVEGTLILNIADGFQIWSNGIFKTVLHRVLVKKDVSRFSVAWIMSPNKDHSLSAPSDLVDDDHPRLYRDITAGEYQQKVLETRMSGADSKVFNGQYLIETLRI